MQSTSRRIEIRALAGLVVGLAVLLAACTNGSSSSTTTTAAAVPAPTVTVPPVAKDPSVASMLPASVAASGQLRVSTSAGDPPGVFLSTSGTLTGFEPDLVLAIGQVLGLRVVLVNGPSTRVVPSVVAGTAQLGTASITDTVALQDQVDMVDYYRAGQGFFVKAGKGLSFTSLSAACGATLAVVRGSATATAAVAQGKACVAAGGRTVTVLVFTDLAGVTAAVASGRASAGLTASTSVEYVVSRSQGRFAVAGPPFAVAPLGFAVAKKGGLGLPVASALNTLIADGTYAAILSKWGIQTGAVTTAVINGATS